MLESVLSPIVEHDVGLDLVVAGFLRLQETLPAGTDVLLADRTFSCDQGALVLAGLCDRYGLSRRLCVGRYWHGDLDRFLRLVSSDQYVDTLSPAAYEAEIAGLAQHPAEHHHWVIAQGAAGPMLLDPNGPVRNEPYAQAASPEVFSSAGDRRRAVYDEMDADDLDRSLGLDPDESPEAAAVGRPALAHALTAITCL